MSISSQNTRLVSARLRLPHEGPGECAMPAVPPRRAAGCSPPFTAHSSLDVQDVPGKVRVLRA